MRLNEYTQEGYCSHCPRFEFSFQLSNVLIAFALKARLDFVKDVYCQVY